MNHRLVTQRLKIRLAAVSVVVLVLQFFGPLVASVGAAGILTNVQVVFDRMKASQFTSGTVCAKEATTSALVRKTLVTFPTGFTVSTTAGNWTTDTTSNNKWPAGALAWPGITTATATIGSQTVTWTATADQTMNALSTYCFNWTNNTAALQQPGSAGNSEGGTVKTQTNGAVDIDSGNFSTATLTNDQVTVSAVVPQTFSFSVGNSDSFTTNLDTSTVSHTSGVNANISTNAINGWIIWAQENSATHLGLYSPTANYTVGWSSVGSNTTITGNSTDQYITGAIVTTAGNAAPATATTVAPTTAYNGGASVSSARGAGLDTSLRQIATANGTTNGSVVQLYESATVNPASPAATDYSDTFNVIAAASF